MQVIFYNVYNKSCVQTLAYSYLKMKEMSIIDCTGRWVFFPIKSK